MDNDNEQLYRSRGNLRAASGWTDRLIKELLNEPDYIKEDWLCGTQGGEIRSWVWRRTRYYLVSRVDAAEKTKVFKEGRRA